MPTLPNQLLFRIAILIAIAISERGTRSKNHYSEQLSRHVYNIVVFESPLLFRKVPIDSKVFVKTEVPTNQVIDRVCLSFENEGDIAMSSPVSG